MSDTYFYTLHTNRESESARKVMRYKMYGTGDINTFKALLKSNSTTLTYSNEFYIYKALNIKVRL